MLVATLHTVDHLSPYWWFLIPRTASNKINNPMHHWAFTLFAVRTLEKRECGFSAPCPKACVNSGALIPNYRGSSLAAAGVGRTLLPALGG